MKQHVSKHFAHRPSYLLLWKSLQVKIHFFQTWSCCISNKRNHEMQQHGSKCFALRARQYPRGWGQKVKIHLFQNMGILHIKLKRITKCSNMVANILPTYLPPPPDPGKWYTGQNQIFSEHVHVAYQIYGNHKMLQHGSKYFAHRPLHLS